MTAEYRHTPVLLDECIEMLDIKPGTVFVDATLGLAGHSCQILPKLSPGGLLIGIDQDDEALVRASARLEHALTGADACMGAHSASASTSASFKTVKGNFGELDDLLLSCLIPGIDSILFDLGVSSPQIDIPERGFSFKNNAPLDMRMDPSQQTLTAQEIINTYDEADLTRIIRSNSDEKWASRIAKFIVSARKSGDITESEQLVEIIKAAIPASARRSGGHPAKRTFQALRMEVNDEVGVLKRGLEAACRWLNPGGRIAVISYHSIEDRIVKDTFASFANRCTCPSDLPICACNKSAILSVITKKPMEASQEEIEKNPRARSAKLRVACKL